MTPTAPVARRDGLHTVLNGNERTTHWGQGGGVCLKRQERNSGRTIDKRLGRQFTGRKRRGWLCCLCSLLFNSAARRRSPDLAATDTALAQVS